MLKNITLFLILTSFLMVSESCKKTKEAIDCFEESLKVTMVHTKDNADSKKVTFTLAYAGSFDLQNVKWEFGDGQEETVTGMSVTHTYADAGSYEVRYTVSIKNDDESCSPAYQETITID